MKEKGNRLRMVKKRKIIKKKIKKKLIKTENSEKIKMVKIGSKECWECGKTFSFRMS